MYTEYIYVYHVHAMSMNTRRGVGSLELVLQFVRYPKQVLETEPRSSEKQPHPTLLMLSMYLSALWHVTCSSMYYFYYGWAYLYSIFLSLAFFSYCGSSSGQP